MGSANLCSSTMSYPGYPSYPPHPQGGQYPQQPQPYQQTTPMAYPVYPGAAAPPGPISGYPSANPYPSYPSNPSSYPSNPYPSGQPAPYPSGQPSPYPSSQSSPYPSSQPSPYPSNQPSPYPSSQPSPYPSSQPSPYPSSQPSSYPSSGGHVSPYPSQYPPPHQSGNQHYSSQNQVPLYGGAVPHGTSQQYSKGNPTVRPAHPFDPKSDAEVLRKAMKGFGTDEKAIIQVLTNRTNAQRQEIAVHFKTMYGKDLIKDLKSELSGNFENLIVALMTPIPEFQAQEIHHAISGIGTNESTLVELMCSATNNEIHTMRQAYQKLFGSNLEQDLSSDTSGSFRRLMVSLCQGRRDENYIVDHHAAVMDAQRLLEAGELMLGTDESTFNAILCQRSYPQLVQIFMEYQRLAGHGIEKAVRGEFSGDIETGLLAIIKSVKDKAGFFAEQLHDSMAGMGTRDRALIRIITIRSEIDLEDIKRAFHQKYGTTLADFIKDDTSGDYKRCLLSLVK
ncbi:annexin B9-like isoform X2 [Macrosteles quadrilineatus]|uniref:annexin B9-like isoform X2 n=1 Tax=Macrosteles quadrilineatus TaxID=74068 RepID=UPI0023E31105|nr:annexin B9-like isoform X2 [Macrosteles quadrilineatus]